MVKGVVLAIATMFPITVFAQQPDFAPIDRELWEAASTALSRLPMSFEAHQQAQQIMQAVEAQAHQRRAAEAAKKVTPPSQ